MTTPKIVHRMCILTRKVLPKSELFRIAKTPHGEIIFDKDQNALGRGMYIQKDKKIVTALCDERKKGLWKHALHAEVRAEDQKQILESLFQILE